MYETLKIIIWMLVIYGGQYATVLSDQGSSCSNSKCDLRSSKVAYMAKKFFEQQQQRSAMDLIQNSVISQIALLLKRLEEVSDDGIMKQSNCNKCNKGHLRKTIQTVLIPKLNQLADKDSFLATENNSNERTKDKSQQNELAESVLKSPVKAHDENGSPILRSCSEAPTKKSNQYWLQPYDGENPFKGNCELEHFGGKWLVIQRRFDGSEDFNRTWEEYKLGFGDPNGEFWLGLETIHRLTVDKPLFLILEQETPDGTYSYATYEKFAIGNETEQYPLRQLGEFNGTAGDLLSPVLGMGFTTKDRDNDEYAGRNCAVEYGGAWWYTRYSHSNLNGKYKPWQYWRKSMDPTYGLRKSRMMIKQ